MIVYSLIIILVILVKIINTNEKDLKWSFRGKIVFSNSIIEYKISKNIIVINIMRVRRYINT